MRVFLLFLLIIPISNSFIEECFCKNNGEVVKCNCGDNTIDSFNNIKVVPLLSDLLKTNFFRFYKVNMFKHCQYEESSNSGKCSSRSCAVNECSQDELPLGFKKNHSHQKNKYSKEANEGAQDMDSCRKKEMEEKKQEKELSRQFNQIDFTISDKNKEAFKEWASHDDKEHNFCELDDIESPNAVYYDLILNPERFTGYMGPSAVNVWKLIYEQNCFKNTNLGITNYVPNEELCLEKKTFYRLISGFHTSINVDITANWLVPPKTAFDAPKWAPNLEEFLKRFDPQKTWGEGPGRLLNLYFTYLVEMKALVKATPYLKQIDYFTGNKEEDDKVKQQISNLLENLKTFPDHFDENKLFQGDFKILKQEFKLHFRNISRILDCVGCDKCRLWGKVQFTGMGTALKILFSGDERGPDSTISKNQKSSKDGFQLKRGEIVALVNAFGRLSQSLHEVDKFRDMMR